MLNKALEAFGELGDDEELGPADWPTVKRYISCLNNIEGEHVHPHGASESNSNQDLMHLKDIRVRLLNGKGTFTFVSMSCYIYSFSSCASILLTLTTGGTSSILYPVFLFD